MTKPRSNWDWLKQNSLWLIGLGLMLASSGLDGVYLSRLMPQGQPLVALVLGLVLNTMSDVAGIVLTYWYGRLQYSEKKRGPSNILLGAEAVAVAYSWFFSWRQLRIVMPAVESEDWRWVSLIAAGFIPLLLAFIGYAQSLRDTRTSNKQEQSAPKPEPEPVKLALPFQCPHCSYATDTQAGLNAHQRVHKGTRSNGHHKQSEPERIGARV